jgi:YVTN family beta-propeller protein
MYTIYAPPSRGAARGPVAFSPDEKKVYLADTQTNDVTIVDVASGERLKNIDAGYGLREVMRLGSTIAAIADDDIRMIDTATDEIRDTIKLSGNVVDALVTEDGKRLVVFGKGRVVVIDTTTGKELARSETFKQPVAVLFGG